MTEAPDTDALREIAALFDPPHPADAGLIRAAADWIDQVRAFVSDRLDQAEAGVEAGERVGSERAYGAANAYAAVLATMRMTEADS